METQQQQIQYVFQFDPTGRDFTGHDLFRTWDMIRPDNDHSITPHNTHTTRMETQQQQIQYVYQFDPTGHDFTGHELFRMWDMIRPDKDHSITPHNTYTTKMEPQQPIFWLILDVTLGLCVALKPYVDNFAPLGGFFFGICVGLSLLWRLGSSGFFRQETLARHYCHYAYAVIGTGLVTYIFTMMRN
jgi:hypothetical protein